MKLLVDSAVEDFSLMHELILGCQKFTERPFRTYSDWTRFAEVWRTTYDVPRPNRRYTIAGLFNKQLIPTDLV